MPLTVPRVLPALVLVLTACTAPEPAGTPVPTGPMPDPDVSSWLPPHAPLPAASRVIFMGDSITAGYGISTPANRYARLLVNNNDGGWPDNAGDDLTARYGELDVVDVSFSGAETTDLVDLQLPWLLDAVGPVAPGPTLAYVTIGGNDLINALLSADLDIVADLVVENLTAVADALADPVRFPDGTLLLVTNVYEPTDGEGQADPCFYGLDMTGVEPVLEDLNARTLALAQERGFAWVDLLGHFRGHGFHHDDPANPWHDAEDPSLWLQGDCIHPNRRGHHELRELFLAATDGRALTVP